MNAQEVSLLPEMLPETTQFSPKVNIYITSDHLAMLSSYCCTITVYRGYRPYCVSVSQLVQKLSE